MKTVKISGEVVESLKSLSAARAKKNEGAREENNSKKVLEATLPEIKQKENETSFMFNGKPVATWTKSARMGIDKVKLQTEFPEVFKQVYVPGEAWTLDILL